MTLNTYVMLFADIALFAGIVYMTFLEYQEEKTRKEGEGR